LVHLPFVGDSTEAGLSIPVPLHILVSPIVTAALLLSCLLRM
jgi:hypothetical protein